MLLETDRLNLRDYRPNDWERVHIYASEPDFSRYEMWGPNTPADSQKYVADMVFQAADAERFRFNLAVCLKANGLLIGGCGLRRESQNSMVANLGWATHPEFQNLGFATEAAAKLIEFGWQQLKLKVIYATCDSRNEASARVMEKLGMKLVGHLIGDKLQKGVLRDTLRYETLR